MGEKLEGAFMIILKMVKREGRRALLASGDSVMLRWRQSNSMRFNRSGMLVACVMMVVLCAFVSCSTDPMDDPIPPITFPDKVLNLNLPDNIALRTKGNSRAYGDIGVRGVIVYC